MTIAGCDHYSTDDISNTNFLKNVSLVGVAGSHRVTFQYTGGSISIVYLQLYVRDFLSCVQTSTIFVF